jgi:hypothetical protein
MVYVRWADGSSGGSAGNDDFFLRREGLGFEGSTQNVVEEETKEGVFCLYNR